MPQSIALPKELEEVFRSLESALEAQGATPLGFNFYHWLDEWLKLPQLALGGSRPTDLMITQDGMDSVRRVLGAIISGAYQ